MLNLVSEIRSQILTQCLHKGATGRQKKKHHILFSIWPSRGFTFDPFRPCLSPLLNCSSEFLRSKVPDYRILFYFLFCLAHLTFNDRLSLSLSLSMHYSFTWLTLQLSFFTFWLLILLLIYRCLNCSIQIFSYLAA